MSADPTEITDLQYVTLICRVPVAEVAVHAGTDTSHVLAELAAAPVPEWAKHWATTTGVRT